MTAAKLSHPDRKLFMGYSAGVEDLNVTGAVHWLEEHVVARGKHIVFVMS